MAAETTPTFNYETLLGMIPVVMDFLDLDSEEIIASGILDDDRLDDAVAAMIISHEKVKQSSASKKPTWVTAPSASTTSDNTGTHSGSTITSGTTVTEQLLQGLTLTPLSRNRIDGFRMHFRMTSAMFEILLQDTMKLTSFSTRQVVEGTSTDHEGPAPLPMVPASMLMLTLRFLGSQQPMDQLADMANISLPLFTRVVHETMDAFYQLMQHYIQWPEKDEVAEASDKFRQRCGLQGVMGIIDVLHVQVRAPDQHIDYYTNQQKETTVLLQTVCDHKLRFLHCCTGWPGSVDEITVLKDSDLHNDVHGQASSYFPLDSFLVGDEAYMLTEWLMTPFRDTCNLSALQLKFNAACKVVLQNNTLVYTLLMHRFPRLECVDMRDMQSMVVTILVCCALHNFCLDKGDLVLFEDAEVAVTVRNINTLPKPGVCTESDEGENKRRRLLLTLL